jgi:hypothetical protein
MNIHAGASDAPPADSSVYLTPEESGAAPKLARAWIVEIHKNAPPPNLKTPNLTS